MNNAKMKALTGSAALIFFSLISCRHPETPAPVIDPLTYVPEMAGMRHWHGTSYTYNGTPGGSDYVSSVALSLDDSISVISRDSIFFRHHPLYFLTSNSAEHSLIFTWYDAPGGTNYIKDTLVYNFISKKILFKDFQFYQGHGSLDVLESP